MSDILPAYTGLSVNNVSYRYTTVKVKEDPMVVNVQNANAAGSGYIFRSTDDWSGLSGNTITKSVAVDNIPIQYWGRGEIVVEGKGEVINPYVLYNFRYDTCYGDMITDPKCPNYKPIIPTIIYNDPLNDEFVKKSLDNKTVVESEDDLQKSGKLMKKEQQDTAKKSISKIGQNALITAEAAAQAAKFEALNNPQGFNLYNKSLPGGVYQDTLKYANKSIPDSRIGLRLNLSQERLHNMMIDLQYSSKK